MESVPKKNKGKKVTLVLPEVDLNKKPTSVPGKGFSSQLATSFETNRASIQLIRGPDEVVYGMSVRRNQLEQASRTLYTLTNMSDSMYQALHKLSERYPTARWKVQFFKSGKFFNVRLPVVEATAENHTSGSTARRTRRKHLTPVSVFQHPVIAGFMFVEKKPVKVVEDVPEMSSGNHELTVPASESAGDVTQRTPAECAAATDRVRRSSLPTIAEEVQISTTNMSAAVALNILVKLTSTSQVFSSFESYFAFRALTLLQILGVGGFGIAVAVSNGGCDLFVLKLIPLIEENVVHVLRELLVTTRLSDLQMSDGTLSFPKCHGCSLVFGRLDPRITSCLQNCADNCDSFAEPTLTKWLAVELDYGGSSLQNYASAPEGTLRLKHRGCAVSILSQVIIALSSAEEIIEFEHRDCHWENILVSESDKDYPPDGDDPDDDVLLFEQQGQRIIIPMFGLKVMLIDFGLARCHTAYGLEYLNVSLQCPSLLKQSGTAQYEVYRRMNEAVGGCWENFAPRTNALWIEYLVEKLLNRIAYAPDASGDAPFGIILEQLQKSLNETPAESAKQCLGRLLSLF